MPISKDVLPRTNCSRAPDEGMITEKDLKILWVSRTLTNIDFEYGKEVLNLERSNIEPEQKNDLKQQLLLSYRKRRAAYQALIESLRR